jgi:hypothetical protein
MASFGQQQGAYRGQIMQGQQNIPQRKYRVEVLFNMCDYFLRLIGSLNILSVCISSLVCSARIRFPGIQGKKISLKILFLLQTKHRSYIEINFLIQYDSDTVTCSCHFPPR